MQISIWDLDWYYQTSDIPNIRCMQLSSFCKQKGYTVNFITQDIHINLNYDKMYIFKNKTNTPMPNKAFLTKANVKLVGSGFYYYHTILLSNVVCACRPDYLLYPQTDSKYSNANFISFYNGKDLIKHQQDFHNVKKNKKYTIVVDKHFWTAGEKNIVWCLEALKQEKNIMFLEPISLKILINDQIIREKFLELNFTTGTQFKWRNDYSSMNIEPIIEFMLRLKKHTKSDLGYIPIKAIQGGLTLEEEYMRCFEVIEQFKRNKLYCRIITQPLDNRILQHISKWTATSFKLSYIEYTLHPIVSTSGILWHDIINHAANWRTSKIDYLLQWLISEEWHPIHSSLFIQWGEYSLDSTKINYNYIEENINLLYKDKLE